MFGWVHLDGPGTPAGAGFIPCTLDQDGVVHPHRPDSPSGAEVVEYVRRGCVTQELPVDLVDGRQIDGHPTVEVVASSPNGGVDPPPHTTLRSASST